MDQTILSLLSNPYFIFAISAWELVWKGWALWRAARRSQRNWFVLLLILNTIGILPIIYLFLVSRTENKASPQPSNS